MKQLSQIASILANTEHEIAAANHEAKIKAELRFESAVRDYITDAGSYQYGGVWNLVYTVVCALNELSEETGITAYSDAAQVLAETESKIDLNYNEVQ